MKCARNGFRATPRAHFPPTTSRQASESTSPLLEHGPEHQGIHGDARDTARKATCPCGHQPRPQAFSKRSSGYSRRALAIHDFPLSLPSCCSPSGHCSATMLPGIHTFAPLARPLPRRVTPCYECAEANAPVSSQSRLAGGTRPDFNFSVSGTCAAPAAKARTSPALKEHPTATLSRLASLGAPYPRPSLVCNPSHRTQLPTRSTRRSRVR